MKNLKKLLRFVIVVTLIIFTSLNTIQFAAFSNSKISDGNRKLVNVAVIFHRINDPFTVKIKESLEELAKDTKNNVQYTFFDSKNNIAIQNEIIDSTLKGNFDLLIINSADKRESAIENIINTVRTNDIPIILMNVSPNVVSKVSQLYNKAVFPVPDSKEAGTVQGNIIAVLWNSNKKMIDKNSDNILQYALLQGKSDDPQSIERSKYSILTINNLGIKTEQLASVDAGWQKELGESSINNLFLKYGGNIEAIISNNDAMAIGAIEALQKYGYNKDDKSKYIAVVGSDLLPEAKALIDKGYMSGTVIQDPQIAAQMFYTIGMNLINNRDPLENTDYKIVDKQVIVPYNYRQYTGTKSTS